MEFEHAAPKESADTYCFPAAPPVSHVVSPIRLTSSRHTDFSRVLGFSIGRNYYTLQLRLPETDPGLDSALVVVWLEVELAYALAASTLSALKAFTESFNSEFGLGFTRGKGDGSYGMSDVSGSSNSPSRLKLEKPKDASQLESGISKDNAGISIASLSPESHGVSQTPFALRPENEKISTVTRVSAEPATGELAASRDNSCADSTSTTNDMVIMHETGYEVQHDWMPILPVGDAHA